MPKVSKTKAFEKELADLSQPNKLSTFSGMYGFESRNNFNKQVQEVLRGGLLIPVENPTRNHTEAFLVQEMIAVCSRLYRAIWKLAGDAAQDSEGSSQPFTILVDESNASLREKIFLDAQKIIRDTRLGLKARSHIARMLITGDVIGQPVWEEIDGKWYLTRIITMPTWEMHYDPRTGIWKQFKEDMGLKPIYTWNIPNYMVRASHDADDNRVYGRSILLALLTNYRQYIASLEDLYVACRTRAPRRMAHYLGDEGGNYRMDKKALWAYKRRNELGKPGTIYTDYYLNKGFEEIKEIEGDAAGVEALMRVVKMKEAVMLEDMGLPVNMQDLAGRHVSESVDAAYASVINTIRCEYNPFVTDLVRKGLRLRGYNDIDIDISIPPLGETANLRWQRVWAAYEKREIDFYTACALVGQKNPFAIRKRIEEDLQWYQKNPDAYMTIGSKAGKNSNAVQGSENPAMGADPKLAEQRRNEQRNMGKKNSTGV